MPIGEQDYRLAAVAETVTFQLGATDWLALRVGGTGCVYTGITPRSALAIGAVVRYFVSGGVTAGWTVRERFRLAAVFDVGPGRRDSLNVLRGVTESLSQEQIVSENLLSTTQVATLEPGLSTAFAVTKWLGLTSTLTYVRVQADDAQFARLFPTGENVVAVSAAADLDLDDVWSAPVGLQASYRLEEPMDDDAERSQAGDVGLFYTGRRDLDLGVLVGLRRFPLRLNETTDAVLLALTVRYNFD